jgi:aminoglycoside phosphotransferase (APT) family kinase protein
MTWHANIASCLRCGRPIHWRRHEVIDAHRRLSGRTIDDFSFYQVVALFRSAIVFLQLFDRWRGDPETNPRLACFGRVGAGLLDFAFELTRLAE